MLQHYLSVDEFREPFLVCMIFGFSSGTRTINSFSSHPRASQIRSKCSKLTLSVNSWYNSLIVFGLIPVALAKSACVHLHSPSLVDNKILIIRCRSFHYKITPSDKIVCKSYFIAESDISYLFTEKERWQVPLFFLFLFLISLYC